MVVNAFKFFSVIMHYYLLMVRMFKWILESSGYLQSRVYVCYVVVGLVISS